MRAKLIRQTLDEQRRDFTRGGDPAAAMGVGMKRKIRDWLDLMNVVGYVINDDMSVDVDGNVYVDGNVWLAGRSLTEFPYYVRFGTVNGYFGCRDNGLVSLEGCPRTVGGDFSCSVNRLVSLEGCPKTVGRDFFCIHNERKFTEEEVRNLCDVKNAVFT